MGDDMSDTDHAAALRYLAVQLEEHDAKVLHAAADRLDELAGCLRVADVAAEQYRADAARDEARIENLTRQLREERQGFADDFADLPGEQPTCPCGRPFCGGVDLVARIDGAAQAAAPEETIALARRLSRTYTTAATAYAQHGKIEALRVGAGWMAVALSLKPQIVITLDDTQK